MNDIELNAILYYADFLSLKAVSQPVTDTCKYFFIHGCPVNSAYILNLEPVYDEENPYFQQARAEYIILRDKFGEDGVESFLDEIAYIKASGSVNAERMLQCIHQFNNKHERKMAFNAYYNWLDNQTYTHITINEDGGPQEKQCSKYVYHAERMLERSGMVKSRRNHPARHENKATKPLL